MTVMNYESIDMCLSQSVILRLTTSLNLNNLYPTGFGAKFALSSSLILSCAVTLMKELQKPRRKHIESKSIVS